MFIRKSNWINSMPELDKMALLRLVDGKIEDIGKPREMFFVLMDIKDNEQLENLTKYLNEDGWSVEAQSDTSHPGWYIVNAKKSDYEINEDNYKNDVALMNRLATMYGIHYDGWYASQ